MKTIYNNKIAIICPECKIGNIPEGFELYNKSIDQSYHMLKSYELASHTLYKGVFVTNNINRVSFAQLQTLDTSDNKLYSFSVTHSGFPEECEIDLSAIFCSSWVLPFVVSKNCNYAFLRKHRIKMLEFNIKPLI